MANTEAPPWTPTQERLGSIAIRVMTAANVWLYRLTGGRLGARFSGGAPVCLVTALGKQSGQPRTVALLYLRDGEDVAIVASKGGMSHHPAWYHNMMAHPDVQVEIEGATRNMRARRASPDEKARLWPRLCEMYPSYADYQKRTTREIPVLILSPQRAR